MRVWLWDAGSHHGVTDEEDRALVHAGTRLQHGDTARVELAFVLPSIRQVTWRYIRTGTGWAGTNASGSVVWRPLLCANHQTSHTPRPHSTSTEVATMEDGLLAFERVHLEKLCLACQVLLGLAKEQFISDPLETELHELQDRIERILLLPDRAATLA
jgi:hypothetical protein